LSDAEANDLRKSIIGKTVTKTSSVLVNKSIENPIIINDQTECAGDPIRVENVEIFPDSVEYQVMSNTAELESSIKHPDGYELVSGEVFQLIRSLKEPKWIGKGEYVSAWIQKECFDTGSFRIAYKGIFFYLKNRILPKQSKGPFSL